MDNPIRNLERLRKIVVKKSFGRKQEIKEIAHKFMVSRKFVYRWLKRFMKDPEGECERIDHPNLRLYTRK